MDKKNWLDYLHYNIDNQLGNLELAYTYLDKEGEKKYSKWKKYLDCDENFIKKADNRTILPNEIVVDIDIPKKPKNDVHKEIENKFKRVFEQIKEDWEFFSAYKTGSRGYHIHLFFDAELTPEEKRFVIKRYKADLMKATKRCLIALENWPHWKTGNIKTLIEENKGFNDAERVKQTYPQNKEKENQEKEKIDKILNSEEYILNNFLDKYPIYFDTNQILWAWNREKFLWEKIDSYDLVNIIESAKKEGLLIVAGYANIIMRMSRLRKPQEPKSTWIQFLDKVYDFSSMKVFDASPKYFFTNPIPFSVGESLETPMIDKLFQQWVGDENKEILYEIIAYCLTPKKFMQRLFALVGGGSNGKSSFITLIQKLLGPSNYTSSELKLLAERNFETAILYKKLLCIIGEVAYNDLSNTSQIKKLSGEDEIRFEFKGKQPFSAINTATIICLTNSLPRTPDKSIGFYRRWLIVDFPNQFPVSKNPVENIPDLEFSNLTRKCLEILARIYSKRSFTNEGSYEFREKIYEEKSNPLKIFLELFCEDTPGVHIKKKDFCDRFNIWLKSKNQRPLASPQVVKMLRDNSYDIGSRKIEGESFQVIVNLSFKSEKPQIKAEKPEITINTTNTSNFQLPLIDTLTNLKNPSNNGIYGNFCIICKKPGNISVNDKWYCKECYYNE